MNSSDREVAGQRIARARRRRGLSQAVLAGLVGRSESWLSQVERGKRGIDSHSVLVRLAEVLHVDIEELTGSGDGDEPGRRVHPAVSLIEQAMMAYGAAGAPAEDDESDREASLGYLRAKARSAYQSYQATRYDTATAAAACCDRATTETVLAKARGIVDRTGETNHMGTAFGSVNVAIHAISASLRLGDPRMATETGEALDTAAMPVGLVGRRTQVNLDLARAYAVCRKDAAAVNLLLAAERLSPQLVRYDQTTRDVLTELLRREHRPSTPELRPLAHRAGVI
jgi:transcriptional regulator with XRE-family HTH domain